MTVAWIHQKLRFFTHNFICLLLSASLSYCSPLKFLVWMKPGSRTGWSRSNSCSTLMTSSRICWQATMVTNTKMIITLLLLLLFLLFLLLFLFFLFLHLLLVLPSLLLYYYFPGISNAALILRVPCKKIYQGPLYWKCGCLMYLSIITVHCRIYVTEGLHFCSFFKNIGLPYMIFKYFYLLLQGQSLPSQPSMSCSQIRPSLYSCWLILVFLTWPHWSFLIHGCPSRSGMCYHDCTM